MLSTKHRAKHISLVIALVMLMTTALGSISVSYAALTKSPSPVQTESVSSSKYYTDEYYKVTTPSDEDGIIYVEGRTQIETKRFCIRLAKHGEKDYSKKYPVTVFVAPDEAGEFSVIIDTSLGNSNAPEAIKGTVTQPRESWGTRPGYKAVETIGPGTYHLTIARARTDEEADVSPGTKWSEGPLGGNSGYAYKEVLLTVKSGQENNPKVVKYTAAIDNNKKTSALYEKKSYHDSSYKGSYVRYQDKYMKDMAFVFKDPGTGKQENLTSAKVQYIRSIADGITAGYTSDYDKLLKIYEYVGNNFYYDVLANTSGKKQYADPYKNLYKLQKKTDSANSKGGKVATTCQGFAALVIALARAENIPARLAYGHHVSLPLTTWATNTSDITKRDHWWIEAWYDGRWVVIDANSATGSKWERSSFSSAGSWNKDDELSYVYFDPSHEQLSASYAYIGIYPGATDGKYINRANEVKQLRSFLNTKSSGKTNGKRLNSKYSSTNFATWGTTAAGDFLTDGYGRVTHILWGKKGLYGSLNLTNFSKLKYLTVYSNNIKSLTLTGCSSLQKISATYTKITSFNSTASKNTTSITAKGNKLKSAKFNHGSKTITISRNVAGGTFAFDYNKSKSKCLTIYASNPAKGYKYLGIYTSSGKKLTSAKTYTFKPTTTKYVVKYKKK